MCAAVVEVQDRFAGRHIEGGSVGLDVEQSFWSSHAKSFHVRVEFVAYKELQGTNFHVIQQNYSKLVDIIKYSPNLAGMRTTDVPVPVEESENADWVQLVKQSVKGLQFGVVQIVVHNAKVVQIEKTEKVRLDQQGH